MSFFDQRDSYRQYGGSDYSPDPRRNSDSFSDDRSRAKRKRWSGGRGGKRGGRSGGNRNINSDINLNDSPIFKEPLSTGPRRSPPPKLDQRKRGRERNNSFRSSYHFEMRDMPEFIEPQHHGSTFHWDGYTQRCRSWQNKHKLAYYRSRCLALEFENQMLFQQINKLIEENCVFAVERGRTPTMQVPDISDRHIWQNDERHTSPNSKSKSPGKTRHTSSSDSDNDLYCDFISDHVMEHLETSIRHQLTLIKEKREKGGGDTNETKKSEKDIEGPKGSTAQKRKEELVLLYGENATKIQELETSLQLNFHRNCEDFKPGFYPSIPLNPETLVA